MEAAKFEVVHVEDIGNRVVKETRVVRNDDRGAVSETGEVSLKPSDVNGVQVVSRLRARECRP